MSGERIFNISGGTYNESIQGDSINVQGNYINNGDSTNVQGNYINISQDISQAAAQIQQRLNQLKTQGYSSEEAQQKVARALAIQAKNEPNTRNKLTELGRYLGDAAANGLIGEAVVWVVKVALASAGFPLP
jgi:uncharacterized protein YoaH (UPF0181 family)